MELSEILLIGPHCVAPCSEFIFPAVASVISGGWIKVLFCSAVWPCIIIMIKPAAEELLLYVYSALQSSLGYGSHIFGKNNNGTLCFLSLGSLAMKEIKEDTFSYSSASLSLFFFINCIYFSIQASEEYTGLI